MNDLQVIALIADILGIQPRAVIFQAFGHNSVTYEALLPERSVIVRMNEDASVFATTARNIATLAKLGLPVPTVLVSDLSKTRFPFAYILLDKIPGRDLRYELAAMTPAQMTRLAEQVADYQSRVMTLPQGAGYGYAGIGERGPHASWWDFLCSNAVLGESGARILRVASRFEPYFRHVSPVCFLDDITVKNVLVQNGKLQGLIDFDCVCYGDPLYWIALTAAGVVSDIGPTGQFYVDALKRFWGLTPEQEQALAFYSAGMTLGFVQRFASSETAEWEARMLNAIGQWLAMCDN